MSDLLSQPLVERQCPSLRAGIVGYFSDTHKAGYTSHRDDVAVILLDHTGQKLLHGPEMRDCIDLQSEADFLVWFI